MSKLIFILAVLVSFPVYAQTPAAPATPGMTASAPVVPAMAAPSKPVAAAPAMVAPMKVDLAPMAAAAPAPAVDADDANFSPADATPAETVVSVMAETPVMEAAPASAPSVPKTTPTNWPAIITAIGATLTALLALLGSLGLLKWTKNARVQMILKITKKGTEAFLAYAEKSPATWDDAVAKILDNTNAVLLASSEDPLTAEEKETVVKLANSYKTVAGK